ncbi:regulatory protein [Prevotella sp. khp7]|uniref:regulatory protein RecX n=1 Tax=Prevotella sp. khp7 TaxID=1761885 RepID=UPI0008CB57E6|nr:regulatory protein RecX [Prevotella sp. khp7]SEV96060.1 regulatory protein [Prevotella sp. khp7]
MKKEMTEQEAYLRLAALCAQAEHCEQEMRDKMRRWGLDEAAQDKVVERLTKERYIDEERYARAFVKDKIRYNKWGRRKVQQALWMKHISDDIQQQVLDEIDEKEYLDVLRPLLKQKRKSIKAESDYELNQKLVRFALSRGFGFDIIRQCLDVNEDDFDEDSDDETD